MGRSSCITVTLLGLAGCCCIGAHPITAESSFQQKGLNRAAFDLSCPAPQLQTIVLTRNDGLGCSGSQMGVTGCGRKATYVCDRSQNWLLNSEVKPDEGSGPGIGAPQR
jgi:hypothetical protein